MAESPKPNKPTEISVERRMLLAFALVGVVLLLSQFLFSPKAPSNTGARQTQPTTAKQAEQPKGDLPKPSAEAATGQVSAASEQTTVVDTKVYRIVFSNRGGVVKSWQLKDYRDSDGKPLELVNAKATPKTGDPLSLVAENGKVPSELNQKLFAVKTTDGGPGISFDYSDGQIVAHKALRFAPDSYLFDLVTSVQENGRGVPHMVAWRGGFGDRTAYAAGAAMKTLFFNASENKLVENEVKVAKDGPVTESGPYSFAGIEDTYFLGVFLPDEKGMKIQTISDTVQLTPDAGETEVIGVAAGGEGQNHFSVFVGPKDLDLLRRVNPKLAGAIDFGWFGFLARPMFLALKWLNDNVVHNYGWSIVLLTILINMALLPLKISGMKGMKKMGALQPQIQAINEKYKGIPLTDPRKAQQNQEIMELYKKHGVNPLGAGCFPLLLQIPFFFAFYKVLSVAIELRGADWLWIGDLAHYDPLYLLPIVMVVTQFVLQKMTPNTTADPAQQRMMMFMPLLFGFLFFKASAGLVLYWLTGNVASIAQQAFINKITPAPAPAPAAAPARQAPRMKSRK